MKKVLLFIFALISINLFSQIQVKEGSFRKIDGFVMLDKHYDDNDNPMALIKISTENISLEQRAKFYFKGNLETYFDKHLQEDGQLYLYVSAVAPFVEIIHPEYGKTEYTFPFDLCDFCGYEMVVQYVPLVVNAASEPVQKKKYHLIVKADQSDATIYIDDNPLDIGEASLLVTEGTNHTWKIECNLYHAETGSVTVNERTVVNKTLRPAFGYINVSSFPEQGAKVFVDGEYIGLSPIKTDKLKSGTHIVRVMKDMYKMKEHSFVVNDGQTTNATLNMSANFVNVTINTDSQSDIYVDEEYKGKGRWTGRLSDGEHIVEARKANHRASSKAVELVLGETKTITLEAPKPIYGSLEINSSPMNANIYIDGKHYGETPNYINEIIIGSHELKLTKQGCSEIKKAITIKEGETLSVNEKLQTGKEISITTDKSGDKIYVDDNYLGISPIASSLSYGTHTIKAERNGKTVSKNINVVQSGGDSSVKLTFFGNQTFTVNGVSFTMIAVEGGTFPMGSVRGLDSDAKGNESPVNMLLLQLMPKLDSDAKGNESPVHNVTLSDYYIGETEVTQELWTAVMGNNPSYYSGNPKRPVEKVTWNACQEFVKKLNQLTGKNFRLPTEAEWEYAARGGKKSKGYKYSGSNTIDDVAWYPSNSGSKTHDVKTKQANELGIYDMSGNVYEWCQDWYGSYSSSSQTNPTGSTSGSFRVYRGGSWISGAGYCRVSYRYYDFPDYSDIFLGLRLSLSQY